MIPVKTRFLHLAALLAVLALVGCGRDTVDTDAPQDDQQRLDETTDVDVAAWLNLSRPELARLADEWTLAIKHDREAEHNATDALELLPDLSPPVRVPVFTGATFSPAAGAVLPVYVKEDARDAAVALHLARFGDYETALKLAEPGDSGLRKKLEEARYEKNYPVEWSRLVGLVLSSSQRKLAGANTAAAARLVHVHAQLRKVLDERAAAGPLGALLLPAGKTALTEAARAWRDPKHGKPALAGDIEKALADWGPTHPLKPALAPGASRDAVARLFGVPSRGKALVVHKPEEVARAADLLALPLPDEALGAVAAFFDDADRLAEIRLVYHHGLTRIYPEPGHLGFFLAESGAEAKPLVRDPALSLQTFQADGLVFDAAITHRSVALGGWVRVTSARNATQPAAAQDLRAFGPVCLDRAYADMRVALAPRQAGPAASVTDKAGLASLTEWLGVPAPTSAVLQRAKEHDVLSSLQLGWGIDTTAKALEVLLPALWSAFGPGVGAPGEDRSGAYLGFTWQDGSARLQLRLPFAEGGPVLVLEDTRGADKVAERVAEAQKRDDTERKARHQAGKPVLRLPRSPGEVNGFSLAALHLGQTKAQAEAALPAGKNYRRKDFPGGVSVMLMSPVLRGSPHWARQLVLRYDAADRLAEVRLRYQEGLAKTARGESLLEQLREGKPGAPEAFPAPWNALWSDQKGSRAAAVLLRWQDDATIRTYQRDAWCSEVVLTDRAAADAGKPLGPWLFLAAGPVGCQLGDTREAVQQALKAPVAASGGADVHRQPASSPYEMALVWYRAGKVSRIIAVHRARPGSDESAAAAAISQVWGRNLDSLGFVRRQEGERGTIAGSYFWHDDRTRINTFVQTSEQGARLMTEWLPWTAQ
jgi:hypothetical protein